MNEPSTPPGTTHLQSAPARKSTWIYTLAIIAVLIASAGGYYYYVKSENPEPTPVDEFKTLKEYCARLAATQKLAEGYVDIDKNLVADTPTDAAKLAKVGAELTFTVVGTDDPAKAAEEWKDLIVALEKATGKKVKYLEGVETIEEQMAAVREGRLHVTAFNTGAVSSAVNTAGFVPLFAPADKDGKYGYQMEVLVRTGAPEKSLQDLKGKKIGFVALSSNSGAKAPMVELKKQCGLLPGRDYKYGITGSHMLSVKELVGGKFDAVCVANDLLKQAETNDKDWDRSKYQSIYTSASFPPLCFGVPHHLPPDLQAKVKDAFTQYKFTAGQRYFAQGKTGFAPVNYQKDWEYVREIDDVVVHLLDE